MTSGQSHLCSISARSLPSALQHMDPLQMSPSKMAKLLQFLTSSTGLSLNYSTNTSTVQMFHPWPYIYPQVKNQSFDYYSRAHWLIRVKPYFKWAIAFCICHQSRRNFPSMLFFENKCLLHQWSSEMMKMTSRICDQKTADLIWILTSLNSS